MSPIGLTRRRFLQASGLALAGTAGGGRYLGTSNALEVTRTVVEMPGVDQAFTVALVADVHAPLVSLDFDTVVAAANAARPDLVLIVGDAINERGHEGLLEMYAPLEARLGKYAVLGNWENWGLVRHRDVRAHYERAGVTFLHNAATDIEAFGIRLVGVDERLNGRPDWSVVEGAPADRPTVVMHHSPGAFDVLPRPAGAPTLMLAGHSHGGQIAPLGRPLVIPPGCAGYIKGHFTRDAQQLYVTRGIGTSHVPFRIGARPELALLEVRRA